MSEFYKEIADVLEINQEQLTDSLLLNNGEWDSVVLISIISLIYKNFDFVLEPEVFNNVSSFKDLKNILRQNSVSID